jgi:MFS transporter, DHA2 family, methylenomycin A resistance protein
VTDSERPFTPSPRARFALVVSLWGVFVSNVTLTVLVVALPDIARELHAPLANTNWVSLAPLLAVAAATPLAGGAADRYGAKRIWVMGFVLTLLGILGSALAPDLVTLVGSRLLTGLGSALFMPAALAIISALYPPAARTTPIGYWTSTLAISPLLGVVVGGYLTELLGWRTLFFSQLALGLPALLAGLGLPAQPVHQQRAFDWQGSLAAALAAAGLLCVFSGIRVPLAAVVTVLATLWLVQVERRAEAPIFPPALLASPAVRHALLSRFAMSFTYMGQFITLPYLLSSLWQLSPSSVALTLAVRPLSMGLVGGLAGRLARRFGTSGLTIFGAWLLLLASIAFAALGPARDALGQATMAFGLAVAGVGLGVGSPGAVAYVSARVSISQLGTVSGLMTLTATLANALGMAGMFALVELGGGVQRAGAYRLSNLGGALVAALAVYAGYALRRHEREDRAPTRSATG